MSRDTDFFKKTLFKEVLSVYRNACKKYRKDTGNGGGKPENFLDWNENEDVKFQHFCKGQSVALLSWIFMKDRECNYILEEEKDTIPSSIQIEGNNISPLTKISSSSIGKGVEQILTSTQTTIQSLLKATSGDEKVQRDANMNYHDTAKTLELTNQMQSEMERESDPNDDADDTEKSRRRKRMKAALEKIQDGVMDSLGC